MTASQTEVPTAGHVAPVHEGVTIPHACEPTADVSAGGAGPGPAGSGRLIGVDVARGLALVGMMAVHLLEPVGPDGEMSTAWVLSVGKASALFAVLAGVGIAFGSGGQRRPTGRRRDAAATSLAVRALLIGAVGLLLGYAVPAETARVILAYYAVLFLLAVPLLSLSTRALVALAAGITVLMPVLSHVVRAELPVSAEQNPTFTDLLTDPVRMTIELTLTGAFPALSWLAYVCVGLAVGRCALGSRGVVLRIGAVGVALAVGASVGSWLLMTAAGGWQRLEAVALQTMTPTEYTDVLVWGPGAGVLPTSSFWWLGVLTPHSATPFDLTFTIGTSLALLAASVLLGRVAGRLVVPLAAAGSMTLTLYAGHLLLTSLPPQPESDVLIFVLQLLLVVVFALLWGRRFARGPLETGVWVVTRRVRDLMLASPGAHAATRSGSRR